MSTTSTITAISNDTLTYAPVALGAITAVEAADAAIPGITKSQIAVNVILGAAQVGEAIPVPSVAAASALVALLVGILNATGIFQHKAKTAAPAATASAPAITITT